MPFEIALGPGDEYAEHMNSTEGDAVSGLGESSTTSEEAGAREGDESVNYEQPALVELELDGTDYRLDSGRAGTALCISTRATGSWGWTFRGEARWQANVLRCKAFDRVVLGQLSKALADAAAQID
jgi:hypothetical protein